MEEVLEKNPTLESGTILFSNLPTQEEQIGMIDFIFWLQESKNIVVNLAFRDQTTKEILYTSSDNIKKIKECGSVTLEKAYFNIALSMETKLRTPQTLSLSDLIITDIVNKRIIANVAAINVENEFNKTKGGLRLSEAELKFWMLKDKWDPFHAALIAYGIDPAPFLKQNPEMIASSHEFQESFTKGVQCMRQAISKGFYDNCKEPEIREHIWSYYSTIYWAEIFRKISRAYETIKTWKETEPLELLEKLIFISSLENNAVFETMDDNDKVLLEAMNYRLRVLQQKDEEIEKKYPKITELIRKHSKALPINSQETLTQGLPDSKKPEYADKSISDNNLSGKIKKDYYGNPRLYYGLCKIWAYMKDTDYDLTEGGIVDFFDSELKSEKDPYMIDEMSSTNKFYYGCVNGKKGRTFHWTENKRKKNITFKALQNYFKHIKKKSS